MCAVVVHETCTMRPKDFSNSFLKSLTITLEFNFSQLIRLLEIMLIEPVRFANSLHDILRGESLFQFDFVFWKIRRANDLQLQSNCQMKANCFLQ